MNEDGLETFNELEDVKPFMVKKVKVEEGDYDDSISDCFDPEGLDNRLCDDVDLHSYNDEDNYINGFRKSPNKSENQDFNSINLGEIRVFFCDECKQSFVSKTELQNHIDYNGHKSQLSSKCFLCQKNFQDGLRFHLWEEHWNLCPFKCKLCSFVSVRPSQISSHSRKEHTGCENNGCLDAVEHTKEVFQLLELKEKEYDLQFQPSLTSFLNSETFSIKESHFGSEYEKYYYMDFRNKDLKPFFCEECQETFISVKELNAHCLETAHTTNTKAVCFICHETLSHADKSLRIHLYSNHLRLKPFKCKLCPFMSYTKHKIETSHSKRHQERESNDNVVIDNGIEYLENIMILIDNFEAKHGLQLGISMMEKVKSGKILKKIP